MNNKLWTKDYTITTLGSAAFVLGNALAGFAMSLFVFRETGSVMDFAIYLSLFSFPQLIIPTVAGAWLDRYSNRKVIIVLDIVSAAINTYLALTLKEHISNLPIFMAAVLVLGTISSLYKVTFKSFYPFVIPSGHEKKAYIISSNIENGSVIMFPLSALVYNSIGMTPLLWINAIFILVAGVCSIFVNDVDDEILNQKVKKSYSLRSYFNDIRAGFSFLSKDKGLIAIIIYQAVAAIGSGAGKVITIPWFIENFEDGEYVYMSVWVFAIIGKLIATVIHSKIHIPVNGKYAAAVLCFLILDIAEGLYLHFPLWMMRTVCFLLGFIEVMVHHLKERALHNYIPGEMAGRYHGETLLFETIGILTGELLTGILSAKVELIELHIISMMFCAVCVVLIMIPNRKHLKKIYNI